MLKTIMVLVAVLTVASIARADDRPAAETAFPARSWTAEFSGDLYREAWNYNVSDEDLFGGSAGVWYPIAPRWAMGAELPVIWVHQERIPSTPLAGVNLLTRRYFPRGKLLYFLQGGAGLSYAARFVPQRGTRFNYLAEGAFGVIHPTSRYAQFIASFRFLHLSNNGLAGRSRNPDIEAFGVRVGVQMPVTP